MPNDALVTYLNDHLAGAAGALNLLDHLIETSTVPNGRDFFTALRAEIAEDRDALEGLLHRAGGELSGLRQLGGWIGERINRLKLLVDDPNKSALHQLEPLELLAIGIYGKLSLWRALAAAQAGLRAFASVDFQALARRAEDQYARVEARRIEVAGQVLVDTPPPA